MEREYAARLGYTIKVSISTCGSVWYKFFRTDANGNPEFYHTIELSAHKPDALYPDGRLEITWPSGGAASSSEATLVAQMFLEAAQMRAALAVSLEATIDSIVATEYAYHLAQHQAAQAAEAQAAQAAEAQAAQAAEAGA